MTRFFKIIGLTTFLLLGFYYTEKMSNIVINNSSLVAEINNNAQEYNIESVSAIIEDEYIIPGLNGYAVNVLESYEEMHHLDVFNAYYLKYNIIKPSISIDNNKDKIIKRGNPNKNMVAIIIKDNYDVIDYANTKNINITRLVTLNTYSNMHNYEQINYDSSNYNKLDKLLNNKICYIDNYYNYCKNSNKYLVEASMSLNNYNLSSVKSSIKSGDIIYINDNVNLSDFKILVRQIYYQDLDISSLSKVISEERD